jgi:hypothetical protein
MTNLKFEDKFKQKTYVLKNEKQAIRLLLNLLSHVP